MIVIPDRFDRACIERFFTESEFFGRLGLFVNVRIPVLIVAAEVRRRGIATHITVYALPVDEEFPRSILRQFVTYKRHFAFSPQRRRDAEIFKKSFQPLRLGASAVQFFFSVKLIIRSSATPA